MSFYEDKKHFLQTMTDIVKSAKYVSVDNAAIDALIPHLPHIEKRNKLWPKYVEEIIHTDKHEQVKRACYAIALNVANQSGCIYKDKNGQTARWMIDGSAAKAVDDKFRQMVEDGDVPTWDTSRVEPIHLNAHLLGVPYADERKKIFAEFMTDKAKEQLSLILDDSRCDDGSYLFTFDYAEALAQAFPVSFGADPFRKKANLVFITLSAYMTEHGINVEQDLIVPTDYRVPQTLHAAGVLDFSAELVEKLENENPLNEDSDEVREIRSACIIAVEELRRKSGRALFEIDGFLWRAPKTGEMEQLKNTLRRDKNLPYTDKPMVCYTMHF